MAPLLSSWPWSNLGNFKYVLCGPLAAKAIGEWREGRLVGNWPLYLLVLFALRSLTYQLWHSYSNMLYITRRLRIVPDGLDFRQIDQEWHWDNFLILQLLLASAFFICRTPEHLPFFQLKGAATALAIHVVVSEPLFYLAHRCLHGGYLFPRYHSLHHSSAVPQPMTAGLGTPAEQLVVTAAMALPVATAWALGQASWAVVFGYVLGFDLLRCVGYSNVEVLPARVFEAMPVLRYLIYSPTYLSVHHKEKKCNFCLFMPLFDLLGNTLDRNTWELHKENSSGKKNERVPDFVFLAHVIDVISSMHVPFVFRSVSSRPFAFYLLLIPLWPIAFAMMLVMWAKSKTFTLSFYNLRGSLHQTWVVPRYGFQYFLPFARGGINEQIELAILRADKMGVKVLSLAALNKNESLNGGGTLFVRKHPELRVRVVHGNTLTAAVILKEIPGDVREVFLTGATSKLGRAIALYLCRKNVRVLMLTLSTERFLKIQKEAPPEHQQHLVQVTKYQAAQNCKTWIVGKWLSTKEQRWAPAGTHFHQFVVPPIIGFRKDCTYARLAAMRLPKDVLGLGCCEYTMERGVVHACHAGGAVHCLEGWTHHEVGAIEVDRIDLVWEAAMKHGLTPV